MSTLDLRPPPTQPESLPHATADAGTIRNWAGKPLPAEANLEPAAILDHLRKSDPAAATHLRAALERFPEVGSQLAGFDLVAVLGRGTFGRVYLARQGALADRFVALKVSPDLSSEAQTLARLQHTNIVPIYSTHKAGLFQAVCMPFFGVATLEHLLRRFHKHATVPATGRQLLETLRLLTDETNIPALGSRPSAGTGPKLSGTPSTTAEVFEEQLRIARGPARRSRPVEVLRDITYPDAVCWIGARLADGLEHAHAHGILHNDLKPANVLLTDEGEPMLLDFGVSEDLRLRVAAPGSPVGGTLPYMAPEHLQSVRDRIPATDARSDVYALGIILFELLTGEHPFRIPTGNLEEELPQMLAERSGRPPRLRRLNKSVSPGLEAIVRKCLEPDPARRYQSAADLRDDLDLHRTHQPLHHVRVPSIRERLRKWGKRHPRFSSNLSLGTATAATLCMCLLAIFAATDRAKRAEAAAITRQQELDLAAAKAVLESERTVAASTARQVDEDLKAAHYLLSTKAPDPETLTAGIAQCKAILARYGLPEDDQWEWRNSFQRLPAAEQKRIRARLTETCLLLARGYGLRAKPGTGENGPLGEAIRVNALAERVAGGDTPRAVWEQRAELFRRLGKDAEATRSTDRAKETSLVTARDYFLSGTEALTGGRFRVAIELLRRSVELEPGDFWANLSLGLAHQELGQLTDAFACYTTAIALWPDHSGGYYARGLVALRLWDNARAKADLDKASELRPHLADVSQNRPLAYDLYLNRSIAHQRLKDFDASLRDLEKAAELGAPRGRVLFQRATLKELKGDSEGAKQDLADGLREQATDDVSLIARGIARLSTDLPAALADFEAALEVNPRALAAMQNKSHVLSKLDKPQEAIQTLDQLLKMYPDYVPARAGRGVLHARLGNVKEALADAQEALKRDSTPRNIYQVAGIYALLDKTRPGSRTEAMRLLTLALRAGFGHDYIETDPDLDPIRNTPEFRKLLDGVRAMKQPL
ncbi:MAG: protein kinase [Planctomycetia bacterium]|nr:protein kinase [Planctomycetia bacterium]